MMGVQRTFRVLVVALLAILLITTGCSGKEDVKQPVQRTALKAQEETETTGTSVFPGSKKNRDGSLVLKKNCQMLNRDDIRTRIYKTITQDGQEVVLGEDIYHSKPRLQDLAAGKQYLAVFTKKPVDSLQWRGETYDDFQEWTIGSEEPPVWEDGGVTVFVVPKEMLASEYWKEIKVVWSDLSLDQTGTDLGL